MDIVSELISAILIGFIFTFILGMVLVFLKKYKEFRHDEAENSLISSDIMLVRFEPVEQAGYRTVLIFEWLRGGFLGQAESQAAAIDMLVSKFKEKKVIIIDEDAVAGEIAKLITPEKA